MVIRRLTHARFPIAALAFATLALAACDPVVNIAGANFPAWLLCAIVGAILAAAIRPVFAAGGIEPHLGPLLVVYPCLAILIGCAVELLLLHPVCRTDMSRPRIAHPQSPSISRTPERDQNSSGSESRA